MVSVVVLPVKNLVLLLNKEKGTHAANLIGVLLNKLQSAPMKDF